MNTSKVCKAAELFYKETLKLAKQPSAGCLFYCPDDETVFLGKRGETMSSPHCWDLFGGRPETFDDGPKETAKREVKEEINTLPKNKNLLGTYDLKTDKHHYIVYIYEISLKEKEKFTDDIKLSHENSEVKWFELDEIPTENLHFDLSWIPKRIEELTNT